MSMRCSLRGAAAEGHPRARRFVSDGNRMATDCPGKSPLFSTFGGIENRLKLRVECGRDPPRDFNRYGARPALYVGVIARADPRLVRGGLLRKSDGLAPCPERSAQLVRVHERMMGEDPNDRPGTMVPIGSPSACLWSAPPKRCSMRKSDESLL